MKKKKIYRILSSLLLTSVLGGQVFIHFLHHHTDSYKSGTIVEHPAYGTIIFQIISANEEECDVCELKVFKDFFCGFEGVFRYLKTAFLTNRPELLTTYNHFPCLNQSRAPPTVV